MTGREVLLGWDIPDDPLNPAAWPNPFFPPEAQYPPPEPNPVLNAIRRALATKMLEQAAARRDDPVDDYVRQVGVVTLTHRELTNPPIVTPWLINLHHLPPWQADLLLKLVRPQPPRLTTTPRQTKVWSHGRWWYGNPAGANR